MPQNYKNHTRILITWHILASSAMVFVMVSGIIKFVNSVGDTRYFAALLTLLSAALIVTWIHARSFALKAQDRAIRAEENFRHYILTGKPHDPRLQLGQVIALRFASDAEMPALAKKAVEENLKPKEIKKLVRDWKADYNRV